MLRELAFNESIRFDPNTLPHINLVCENCGKIIDLDNSDLDGLLKSISEKRGFSVKGYRLDVYGVCRACNKTGK